MKIECLYTMTKIKHSTKPDNGVVRIISEHGVIIQYNSSMMTTYFSNKNSLIRLSKLSIEICEFSDLFSILKLLILHVLHKNYILIIITFKMDKTDLKNVKHTKETI